jgi:hypothetical protein
MCISLWAPGKALTVEFLLEQIWLRGLYEAVEPCEAYDVLLQNDDDGEIPALYALFGHAMSLRADEIGELECTPPTAHGSQWDWYYRPESNDTDPVTRTLVVIDPATGETQELVGDVGADTAEWYPDLKAPDIVTELHKIRKSLFRIILSPPLRPYRSDDKKSSKRWLRIIARPKLLDIPTKPRNTLDELGQKSGGFIWNLGVNCPANLNDHLERALRSALHEDPTNGKINLLYNRIVSEGFRSPGTCVRILDHRVVVGTCEESVTISSFSSAAFDRIKLVGPRSVTIQRAGKPIPAEVTEWQGGACRNDHEDLHMVALQLLQYVLYKPSIPKENLVNETASSKHRAASVLVDKMCEVGLLNAAQTPVGIVIQPVFPKPTTEQEKVKTTEFVRQKLVALRKLYLDPNAFIDYPEAQKAFCDLHRFTIPFEMRWRCEDGLPFWSKGKFKRVLRIVMVLGAISGFTSLIWRLLETP